MKFDENLVRQIASQAGPAPDRETVRDLADLFSGGELDHVEIEILTDMAVRAARTLHAALSV
jgi:hypothetical protein